ncbi:hypothetical protein BJ322DRAFT_1114537 [Thelephora terrestris]|uniref:Uncharacterized protein n=1 Tax=Thelephora terrestris TaxID=56493 RepID=A0A9P6H2E2_9AGAM|nr:hypothetical protein BJ322DRAFT_1114537 [Thelephora terrestris]
MSLSPSLAPSLLIEQLRLLEAQIPPPGVMVSTANTAEQVTIANQILAITRQLREKLATESTEASQKLSQAILDIVAYSEQVENMHRLLSLADSCVGQIRSRMHAHGIPIDLPSVTSSAIAPSDAIAAPDTFTVSGTMPNTVSDTMPDTVSDTVSDTTPGTVSDTMPDAVSDVDGPAAQYNPHWGQGVKYPVGTC